MKETKIEWCDYTVNLWWGCSEVSEACKNCYAKNIAKRFKKECWGDNPRVDMRKQAYEKIEKIARKARKNGVRYKVFINSMSDFFEHFTTPSGSHFSNAWRFEFYENARDYIDCLDFLLLTKRPQCITWADYICLENTSNLHLGITAETQARLDERMNALKDFKTKVFLSCEPLLAPLYIEKFANRIDWLIVGGETGHKARFCDWRWIEKLSAQALVFQIPFFFKKYGANSNKIENFAYPRNFPTWRKANNEKD